MKRLLNLTHAKASPLAQVGTPRVFRRKFATNRRINAESSEGEISLSIQASLILKFA